MKAGDLCRRVGNALHRELTHDAAGRADMGTESLIEQALMRHTSPEDAPMATDLHRVPAAFQRPAIKPAPIPFPERPANARTDEPSESTRRRWARMAAAEATAREAAREEGVLQGYRQGWRWGLACGLVAGALIAGLCWGTWLVLDMPGALPAASTQLM